MGKKISIIVIIILVLSLAGWFLYQKRIEDENLMFKQKYSVLNQLKVEEFENMPSETFESLRKLFKEYHSDTEDKNNRERIESLLPNIPKIDQKFWNEANRRDMARKAKIKNNYTEQNYDRFLREIKGIKDENIIKPKLELFKEEGVEPKEERDEFVKYILSL